MHLVAVRVSKMIHPGPVICTDRVDDECVTFPVANRVSPPAWQVHFFRKLPPIRPDRAPRVGPLEVLDDSVGEHNELDGVRINERTGYALRIAVLI